MKATIEVKDRREADAIRTGLEDPAVRAFVVIMGVLMPLTERQAKRVLTYVTDKLEEESTLQPTPVTRPVRLGGNGDAEPA